MWMTSPSSMEKISVNFNKFWTDIFLNWYKLDTGSTDSPEDILHQSLWFNDNLMINGFFLIKNGVKLEYFFSSMIDLMRTLNLWFYMNSENNTA